MRKDLFAGLWCPECRYHICRCGGAMARLAQLMKLPHDRGQEAGEPEPVTLDELRAAIRLHGWHED